jgi:Ca-activated chloride channel family protein
VKYRYTKYTGDLMDEIDLEDLVSKLSDLLLSSGLQQSRGIRPTPTRTARCRRCTTPSSTRSSAAACCRTRRCSSCSASPPTAIRKGVRQQLEDLIQQIIDRMMERGFITGAPDLETERERRAGMGGSVGEDTSRVQFEVTDKALDFLGYRALRDLLGSVGRSSSGLHDTRHLSTASRPSPPRSPTSSATRSTSTRAAPS